MKWTNNPEFDNQKTAEAEVLGAIYSLRVGRPVIFTDCHGNIPSAAVGPFACGIRKVANSRDEANQNIFCDDAVETVYGGFRTVREAKAAAEEAMSN